MYVYVHPGKAEYSAGIMCEPICTYRVLISVARERHDRVLILRVVPNCHTAHPKSHTSEAINSLPPFLEREVAYPTLHPFPYILTTHMIICV